MGTYQGRVKNPLIGDVPEPVRRDGFAFEPTEHNRRRWRAWWRVAQLEHFLTFAVGLLVVATLTMSVAVRFAAGTERGALEMWLLDVVPAVSPVGRALVFLVLFLALFTTQYAIVESFVRNSADILYEMYGRSAGWDLSRLFWGLLTGFLLWGAAIIAAPIQQPFALLIMAAASSGVIMWPYIALTAIVNAARLPAHVQPGWIRVVAMWWATAFFGYFSVLLIGSTLAGDLGLVAFRTTGVGLGSGPGGYVLWSLFVAVQAYTIYRTTAAKVRSRAVPSGYDLWDVLR